MKDISQFLFRREHFPIVLREGITRYGSKFWDLREIQIPPYHPSMRQGIDLTQAVSVIDEALQHTVLDLQEIVERSPNFEKYLEGLVREPNGKIMRGTEINKGDHVMIPEFPFLPGGTLYLYTTHIRPGVTTGVVRIAANLGVTILVPEGITFSEELRKEYDLKESPGTTGFKRIESPYGWHRHNLYHELQKIFCKNFAIALDNAAVVRKYGTI